MVSEVLSTYRLQLRGPDSGFGFTFADATELLDYLDKLGVSHVYLSPILTPVHGRATATTSPIPRQCLPNSAARTGWPGCRRRPGRAAWG